MFLAKSLKMELYLQWYFGLVELKELYLIAPLTDWPGSALLTFPPRISQMTEEDEPQGFVGEGNSIALNSLLQVE